MDLRRNILICGLALAASALPLFGQAPPDLSFSAGGVIRGPVTEKKIALAFSGDRFAESGGAILASLENHRARASFFLTGNFLANRQFAPLVRRMIAEKHYIGPHSDRHLLYCDWADPKKTLVTPEEFRADLSANLGKLAGFGVERKQARYFLPAFEHYNEDIARWAGDAGLRLVNFTPGTRANADYTGEADKNFAASRDIFDSILRREQEDPHGLNGFILLMHLGSGPGRSDKFSRRLDALLTDLAGKGYLFVRVDELLAERDPVYLRANQVGYKTCGPKVAIAFSKSPVPETFSVLKAETRETVFSGTSKLVAGAAWGAFTNHAELDFSPVTHAGNYVLLCGGTVSLPFTIAPQALAPLPDELLEFMREQRCGYNPWLATNCHSRDGRTAYGPLTNGTPLDVTGGWHDAGDLLKYLITSETATAQMLLAYAAGPRAAIFEDHVDSRGNSGANGSPDILDEARWGLDWMLKMHPAADQLYFQVADDRDHSGWRLPPDDQADYGWGAGGARVVYFADGLPQGLAKYKSASTGVANLAGTYAAAMALASQIWKNTDKEFAARCLRAAREVYELGRAREGVQQGNSYRSPYRYAPTIWAGDMEWGAAELYRATGEQRFLGEAKHYARLAGNESWMGKEQTGHYQFYPFVNPGHFRLYDLVEDGFKKQLASYYRDGIESCVRTGKRNPYRIGVPFIWCSDNLVAALVIQSRLYERMTGDTRYQAFTALQTDWLLGRNPWGAAFITGIGSVYPRDVHLMTTHLTGRSVRGALVDGPVYERIFKSLAGVTIRTPDPFEAFQGEAVYHDDLHDYSSNEPTMDGTASAILMFALEN